jgi:predicted SAM-dependent methyltransferase
MTKKILNRQNLFYNPANVILKSFFFFSDPTLLLSSYLQKYKISHINLGGFRATEGYLGIQLSPVQLYGIPFLAREGVSLSFNLQTGEISQTKKILKKPALMLHYNLLKGMPVKSATIDGINMSHFFEHFTRDVGVKILRESYRVLKPGGVLRISCPDLLTYAKAYIGRDSSFFNKPEVKMACRYEGLTTYGDILAGKAYDNDLSFGHKWFYDAESISVLLEEVGFSQIENCSVHQSQLPNIEEVEPVFRAAESFYVEAVK